jgi:hypothetical protein
VIYEVRREVKDTVISFGARRTRSEAEQLRLASIARIDLVGGGDATDALWIEEIDDRGLFEVPSQPAPRERYTTRITKHQTPAGHWRTTSVEVLDGERTVGAYERNYSMLRTFEPFRQGDRHFALVSPFYTATSVMDLSTGEIVASEPHDGGGFCPAGFYVPDWWDVHSAHQLPGSLHWTADYEWPTGEFGFVWGCHWGDDSSWKIQYLDLSEVSKGIIRRDDRFGYLRLAARPDVPMSSFIRVSRYEGRMTVTLSVEQAFDLATGAYIVSGHDED